MLLQIISNLTQFHKGLKLPVSRMFHNSFFGISVSFCSIALGFAFAASIPNFIHICQRNDPQVSKCIQRSVEELRPRLKTGIPEMNVPSLEPFRIDNIEIARGTGPSSFNAVLHNVDVFGASEFVVTKLQLDVPNHTYTVGLTFTLLKLTGDYEVDAKVLVVPIKGHGKFYANATNCDARAVLKGEIIDVNGERHMHFSSLILDVNIADYSIRLENLFEGDQILGQAANDVLNQNKGEFILVAKPHIEKKASEILLKAANNIVRNFSYDELFPEK